MFEGLQSEIIGSRRAPPQEDDREPTTGSREKSTVDLNRGESLADGGEKRIKSGDANRGACHRIR